MKDVQKRRKEMTLKKEKEQTRLEERFPRHMFNHNRQQQTVWDESGGGGRRREVMDAEGSGWM